MEQPELHLHPRFQAKFADLLVKVIEDCKGNKKDVRFIIETHSEVILNKIGLNIAREKFSKDDVNVLLFNAQNEKMNNYIEVATYSEDGYLTNWPIGFFDDYVD
jgi:predicted ATPase